MKIMPMRMSVICKEMTLLLMLSFYVLTGCKGDEEKIVNQGLRRIEVIKKGNDINVIDKLSNLRVIPLMNDSVQLIKIDKIISFNEKYYILDRQLNALQVYKHDGSYLFSIGKRGEGPGEHSNIADFDLDSKRNTVFLYCTDKQIIMQYSTDGRFIRQRKVPFWGFKFGLTSDGHYVFYTGHDAQIELENKLLVVVDSNFKLSRSYFKGKGRGITSGFSGFLLTHYPEQSVLFNRQYSDTVYSVSGSDDQISAKYVFLFGKSTMPEDIRINFSERLNESLNYAYLNSNFAESSDYIVFSYTNKGFMEWGIYDKKRGSCYNSENIKKNLIYKSLIESPALALKDKDTFIGVLYPETMVDLLESDSNAVEGIASLSESYKNALVSMKKSDKPYLLLYNIK